MKLRQLAYSNIKHNFRKYAMYFLSLCFSVFTTYAFLGLMFNESVTQAFQQKAHYKMFILAFGVIILVFVFFFMLNANNSFIRARKKEISVYSLFGMPNSKIGKLLFTETIIVGFAALAVGITLGTFFSKLTAMILIDMTIPEYTGSVVFNVSFLSIFITAALFFAFFCVIGLSGLRVINKFELVDLFKGDKVSEGIPKGSWILLIISLGLIGYGYYIASSSNVGYVIQSTLLILGTVILGTYIFFLAGLPKILAIIKKRKKSYYKTGNLIAISSFGHRIRSVGAAMATIAVLSAVATTAVATGFALYASTEKSVYEIIGYDARIYGNNEAIMKDVKRVLDDNDAEIVDEFTVQRYITYPEIDEITLETEPYSVTFFGEKEYSIRAISETEYNRLIDISKTNINSVNVGGTNNVIYISSFASGELADAIIGKEVRFSDVKATVVGVQECGFIQSGALHAMVFSDDLFLRLVESGEIRDKYNDDDVSKLDKLTVLNYTKSLDRKLNEQLLSVFSQGSTHRQAYIDYAEYMMMFGLIRFIGFFMGAIVILMTASMLYFKQMMAAEEDRHLYRMLRKIGMDESLQRKAVVKRLLPVFVVPLVVGIIHSIFAMKSADTIAFSNILLGDNTYLTVLGFSAVMYLVYAIVYTAFYFITKSQYVRVIKS